MVVGARLAQVCLLNEHLRYLDYVAGAEVSALFEPLQQLLENRGALDLGGVECGSESADEPASLVLVPLPRPSEEPERERGEDHGHDYTEPLHGQPLLPSTNVSGCRGSFPGARRQIRLVAPRHDGRRRLAAWCTPTPPCAT